MEFDDLTKAAVRMERRDGWAGTGSLFADGDSIYLVTCEHQVFDGSVACRQFVWFQTSTLQQFVRMSLSFADCVRLTEADYTGIDAFERVCAIRLNRRDLEKTGAKIRPFEASLAGDLPVGIEVQAWNVGCRQRDGSVTRSPSFENFGKTVLEPRGQTGTLRARIPTGAAKGLSGSFFVAIPKGGRPRIGIIYGEPRLSSDDDSDGCSGAVFVQGFVLPRLLRLASRAARYRGALRTQVELPSQTALERLAEAARAPGGTIKVGGAHFVGLPE
jgi:hypothetical protein